MRWTPRTAFWQRGTEAGEPDLKIDIPGRGPLFVDVAVVFPFGRAGRAAQAKEGAKEAAYPVWADQARVAHADFSPFVFEAFGRCGRQRGAQSACSQG